MPFVLPLQVESELNRFPSLRDPFELRAPLRASAASGPSPPPAHLADLDAHAKGNVTGKAVRLLLGYAEAILRVRDSQVARYTLQTVPDSDILRWVEFTAMADYYRELERLVRVAEKEYGISAQEMAHISEVHTGHLRWVDVRKLVLEWLDLQKTQRTLEAAFPALSRLTKLLDSMSEFKTVTLPRLEDRLKREAPLLEEDMPLLDVRDTAVLEKRIQMELSRILPTLSSEDKAMEVERRLASQGSASERKFVREATLWTLSNKTPEDKARFIQARNEAIAEADA